MAGPADSTATCVDDVLITTELARRPARPPNYEAESRALVALASAMAESPAEVFQKLADSALELCQAGSAGISVWDPADSEDVFRWRATAGDYAPYLGATMPRAFSPCGTVLDRNCALLMADPVRFFPYIEKLESPVREVLLVPFYQGDVAVGTVWVVSHVPERRFDAEDARLVGSLTKFAGAAVLALRRSAAAERAERALRESEALHRALVNATSDVVYRMSADWSVMQPVDGRTLIASSAEPIHDWMEKNLPEFEHARIRADIQRAIAEKKRFEATHRVIRADGSLGWTFSRAIPILDAAGGIVEWFGAASDVTRRMEAEEELRDVRSRMEAALSAGAIGTWSWDVPSNRFYGDPSFARIFSVPQAVVSGGPIAGVLGAIHPDDRARVGALVSQAVASGGRYDADYRLAQADGSWKWVSARGLVERNERGEAVRFPGVVIDVTDRKRVEEDLARVTAESGRRKRLYEAVLSSTPDLAYVWDLQHRFIYANDGLLRMWGKNWDEAIGKTCLELGYEPWHAAMHDREVDQVAATKQSIRGEVPFAGTFGRRIYDYILVPVFGADVEVEAVAGTTRDVTERKAAEESLRDADRRKDDFIALLAHELRNPLAPIRNGLQVLKLAGADAAAAANARAIMDRQLAHMVRLIDDLLDVSRVTRNKMELRRGRVTLAEVVGNATEAAGPAIQAARHELVVDLPPTPIVLDADLTRLAQVFSNLLANSAKYTHPGGRIALHAERAGGEVVVSVRDDGIGIPRDALPTIFDMFSQVDRSIERSTGGLGIGLALVKGLVEMHGGSVSVESAEGRGSTFTVRLPMAGATDAAQVSASADGGRSGSGRRILVADDNRDGAESMALMLRLRGDQVRTAHDGQAAVEAAEAFRPQVILMDLGMPRLNGLEATRLIRESSWGSDVVVVAVTGWGQESDRERSRDAGCDGHLVKPVNLSDLDDLLRRLQTEPSRGRLS